LGLLIGLLTRFTALSIGIIMAGAISLVHWPNGFFMNWSGKQQGEGYEYHLLVLAICAVLLFTGAGKWSVDDILAKRLEK
jgi:putative oxidoreductase